MPTLYMLKYLIGDGRAGFAVEATIRVINVVKRTACKTAIYYYPV